MSNENQGRSVRGEEGGIRGHSWLTSVHKLWTMPSMYWCLLCCIIGDEDGIIDALIPLELIRDKGKTGSDVAINWIDGFVLDASLIPKS